MVGAERWYRIQPLADGLTLIDEPHIKPFYRCNIWHVRGRDRDLLFDTGLGHFSLSRHVAPFQKALEFVFEADLFIGNRPATQPV